jgi:hypothetical protein
MVGGDGDGFVYMWWHACSAFHQVVIPRPLARTPLVQQPFTLGWRVGGACGQLFPAELELAGARAVARSDTSTLKHRSPPPSPQPLSAARNTERYQVRWLSGCALFICHAIRSPCAHSCS